MDTINVVSFLAKRKCKKQPKIKLKPNVTIEGNIENKSCYTL